MNGKITVNTSTDALLEGVFYWPVQAQCTENDKHTVMDLLIIWRFVSENATNKDEATELDYTITTNLDSIVDKWIKITSNSCLDVDVRYYTIQLLRVILTKIWTTGFEVSSIRQYYPVIFKAARDIEALSGLGFKKLFYSKIVIIPTTVPVDGILRKRPINYYGINICVITRKLATIEMLQDFANLKNQVKNQEKNQNGMSVF